VTPRLRIAMVIGSLAAGGAEGQALLLARLLRTRGHDARLFLLRAEGPLLAEALASGIPVVDLALPHLRPWRDLGGKVRAASSMLHTVRSLRRFHPEVVHAWLFEAEAWAAAAKLLGAPGVLVTSRRVAGGREARTPWRRAVRRQATRMARAIVANSAGVARDALARERGFPRERLSIIRNAVEPRRFTMAPAPDAPLSMPALEAASHIVVSVANLRPGKGHRVLADAWARVHERHPAAHLLCAGSDGGEGEAFLLHLDALGLRGCVHWLGPRLDVADLLRTADLFVLASEEEGLPNAVLEAMACGRAVVSTRAAGCGEAVADGRTGRLVPVGNPDALAEAVCALLDDGDTRREMGRQGRRRAERLFSPTRLAENWERLYLRVR